MSIQSYQDLEVWRRGMDLAEACWKLTRAFPPEERYGMTSQIRRASSSIPANLAEGWARRSTKEFQQFIRVAQGSLRELETHLMLCTRVDLTPNQQTAPLLQQASILGRQLLALSRSLNSTRP